MWVRNPGVSRITQPVCTCVHLGSPGLLPCLLPGGHMSARTPQFPGCILSCNQGWVSEGWTLFWGLHSVGPGLSWCWGQEVTPSGKRSTRGSRPGEARRTVGFPCPQQGRLKAVLALELKQVKG